jgi:hypothetical protein
VSGPTATSFLVFLDNRAAERIPHDWSRVDFGDIEKLDRLFRPPMAIIPLRSDADCFQQDFPTSRETDNRLFKYLGSFPQLRILPGGDLTVVVYRRAEGDDLLSKIHRFEAPGAAIPFGGDEMPRFHALPRDLARKIARYYVCTCSVPLGESVGLGLTWTRWRSFSETWSD